MVQLTIIGHIALVFVTIVLVRVRSDACPALCSCLGGFIDCSNKGLTTLPPDIPTWAENVELRKNNIETLEEGAFRGLVNLVKLDLSSNRLRFANATMFYGLSALKELKLDGNLLTTIPDISDSLPSLTHLSLAHNAILSTCAWGIRSLPNLRTLDLSHNRLSRLGDAAFVVTRQCNADDESEDEVPAVDSVDDVTVSDVSEDDDYGDDDDSSAKGLSLNLHSLILTGNRIGSLSQQCFKRLGTLRELRLSRNRIDGMTKEQFAALKQLKMLDLSRNRITEVHGLSFNGLSSLRVLKLRRNGLRILGDGAFYGLENLHELALEDNQIAVVSKRWLYGLTQLRLLQLAANRIVRIEDGSWEFCPQLTEIDLNDNALESLDRGTWERLSQLKMLFMERNRISSVEDGTFRPLASLQRLELANNDIGWLVEDDAGSPFAYVSQLTRLGLASNSITSVMKRAFAGLSRLQRLDLSQNEIASISQDAFAPLVELQELKLNTSGLICDCNLRWLPMWLQAKGFVPSSGARCAHPKGVSGFEVTEVPVQGFTCAPEDSPRPVVVESPVTQVALKGNEVRLRCVATSTAMGPLRFRWKKQNRPVEQASLVRLEEEVVPPEDTEKHGPPRQKVASVLVLGNVSDDDEGSYQCVISNQFGATYSKRANITVHVFPTFTKRPADVTVRVGQMARLECAAGGHPVPEVSWRKDGGDDFPAARERRMHVMPTDDVFFIVEVKAADAGVYSCAAHNDAGVSTANATLTVHETPSFVKPMENKETASGETAVLECLASGSPRPQLTWKKDGKPFEATERHFFTADNQLLIIVHTESGDAGEYECHIANALGAIWGRSKLTVLPSHYHNNHGGNSYGPFDDGSTITGVIVIAVVMCVVVTSLVWVLVIYHTRKREAAAAARAGNSNRNARGGNHCAWGPAGVKALGDTLEEMESCPVDSDEDDDLEEDELTLARTALCGTNFNNSTNSPIPVTLAMTNNEVSKIHHHLSGSAHHLHNFGRGGGDTNSEHSSGKDSGTGDSAKRSSDELFVYPGDNDVPLPEGATADDAVAPSPPPLPPLSLSTDGTAVLSTFRPTNHEWMKPNNNNNETVSSIGGGVVVPRSPVTSS